MKKQGKGRKMRNKKIKGIRNNRGKESISDTICCQLITMSTKINLLMQVNSDKIESIVRKGNQNNPFQHHRHHTSNVFIQVLEAKITGVIFLKYSLWRNVVQRDMGDKRNYTPQRFMQVSLIFLIGTCVYFIHNLHLADILKLFILNPLLTYYMFSLLCTNY